MENLEIKKFIPKNSPDGEFLQSEQWRKFQETFGRRTFCISPHPSPLLKKGEGEFYFHASVIEHQLPIVGKYFYLPRGPVCQLDSSRSLSRRMAGLGMTEIINLAKKEKAGWIRIDPASEKVLEIIKEYIRPRRTGLKIQKAPHDMQPRELFIVDITKPEEQLLSEMKAKTRYNIKLSQKRGVSVKVVSNESCHPERNEVKSKDLIGVDSSTMLGMTNDYIKKFIELVKITAKRDGITPHPESYYRKMFETIPGDILKLYVAEYEGKIIAANIIIFYGNTATYLHGASDNEYRNVMAPYLLQWQAILDAKKAGLTRYDFGGIKMCDKNSWSGITRFKTGFSPNTKPIVFPGSYDIIISRRKYFLYRFLQCVKTFWVAKQPGFSK